MQDEEAYYKQSESEYIPHAFMPLVCSPRHTLDSYKIYPKDTDGNHRLTYVLVPNTECTHNIFREARNTRIPINTAFDQLRDATGRMV
jgi:hypothetical protein